MQYRSAEGGARLRQCAVSQVIGRDSVLSEGEPLKYCAITAMSWSLRLAAKPS